MSEQATKELLELQIDGELATAVADYANRNQRDLSELTEELWRDFLRDQGVDFTS